MSNYTKATNFTAKDSLTSGNPAKVVKGSEIDTEFTAIQTAVNSKADLISATLVTPNLGTPSAGVLTNATGLPISTGVSGLATGVATLLGTPSSANLAAAITDETGSGSLVFATSPTLVTPALGTPSALVGTNITGTAAGLTSGNVTTNANLTGHVTSVGNAAVLGSFTSAQLATALTDETGSGASVFATSPTLVTPALGTPSAIVLTNASGTASININGTVGATTPAAGAFTTLSATGAISVTSSATFPTTGMFLRSATSQLLFTGGSAGFLFGAASGASSFATLDSTGLSVTGTLTASGAITNSAGTANGVTYLNGSKVLTSGSGLQFDGTNLGIGGTPQAWGGSIVTAQINRAMFAGNAGGEAYMTANVYYDGTVNRYIATGYHALQYLQSAAGHVWNTAPVNGGAAGAVATMTERMNLSATGLAVTGTLSASGVITTTATTGTVLSVPAAADNNRVFLISNTGSTLNAFFGMTAANNYVTGAGNGDFIIRNDAGNIGFAPGNGGAAYVALVSSTGLAVTGTLSATGAITNSAGTANGVTYLNGSKVLTSGSGLQFDGTNLGLGVTPSAWRSSETALQVGTTAALTAVGGFSVLRHNNYVDSVGQERYLTTSTAAALVLPPTGGYQFLTAPSGTAGNAVTFTEKARIDSDGLKFNGDTAAANALDDYEEGTFTPTASFAAPGTVSTSGAAGVYTKVGNVVTVMGRIAITKGTASGALELGGLPFASVNTSLYQCAGALSTDAFGVAGKTYQIVLTANTTAPSPLVVTQATGDVASVTVSDFYAGAAAIRYAFSYQV